MLTVVCHVAESIALETPQGSGDIRPDFEISITDSDLRRKV